MLEVARWIAVPVVGVDVGVVDGILGEVVAILGGVIGVVAPVEVLDFFGGDGGQWGDFRLGVKHRVHAESMTQTNNLATLFFIFFHLFFGMLVAYDQIDHK